MFHQIGALMRRKPTNPVDALSLAAVFSDKNIRVDLKERSLPCGHVAYWVVAYWYCEETRDWTELALIHESDLERVLRLLQEAKAYVNEI